MPFSFRLSRRAMLALGVSGLALGLAGSPAAVAADPALLAAARKEGEVVWYTTLILEQAVRPLAAAWARKYPEIKLTFSRAGSADQATKILNEARVGRLQADVFDGSTTIFPLIPAGLVENYKPAAAAQYPTDFKDADGRWTAINAYYMIVAYNSKSVAPADVPKRWEDLLSPKFQGQIAVSQDESVDGLPGLVGQILGHMGQEKGMAYLRKLGEQKLARAANGQRVVLDKIIAGEYALGITMYLHHVDFSAPKGAPIVWAPIEPTWATKNYLSLLKGAPHPNAGKLLIEFLLSEEGQSVLRDAGYAPVHPNVTPGNPALRPATGTFVYTTVGLDEQNKRLPEWVRISRELFR